MTRNKRLLISSILLGATAIAIFNINNNAEAIEVCNNTGQNTVTAQIDPKDGEAHITNASDSCAYNVGVASFKETAQSKELYDVKYGLVKKNDTIALNIEVPDSQYRYESFVGDLDNHQNIATKESGDADTTQTPEPTPSITQAPTASVPTTTTGPSITPTTIMTPTNTPTPTPTAVPTPAYQIINNNNNTNNNHNEQRIIIEENGNTRELVVENGRGTWSTVTKKGQPIYAAPRNIKKTPGTGPEILSLLMLIPTGAAGYFARRAGKRS